MNAREILQRCFDNPANCLGGIERNVEVKIVFLTMVELGWDPATNLGLNFQIPKELFGGAATTSLAIDMVARDDIGICVAGEIKAHRKVNLDAHVCQILRYQDALRAPLAFLTNGSQWMLFRGQEKRPYIDQTFTSVDEMLDVLGHHLCPSVVKGNPAQFDWQWGIGHKDKIFCKPLKETLSSAVEPLDSSDSVDIRHQLLDEIDRLADAYTDKVYRDHTENAAQLKRIGNKDAFVEIRFGSENLKKYPKGYVVKRTEALAALPIPDDIREHFASYCGRGIDDVSGFIKVIEELIGYL
jgi:hypothetical protein